MAQQVSDADRATARELYTDGETLRLQGKYTDAIDRFTRSFSLFPAPTTAFRLAQCRAAVGQLVEAEEGFRALTNTTLPAGAPEAFVKAKQDAATELNLLEPRIPKVKIFVQPASLQGLSVMVDNTSMPVAALGVPRPINPGRHTITASAPGYNTAQQQVEVRERQQPVPEVTLTLQPGASTTYTTVPPNTGQTTVGGTATYQQPYTGQTYTGQPYGQAYTGQPYGQPYGTWIPPRPRPRGPSNALWLGIDADLALPFDLGAGNLSRDMGTLGGSFGVDAGFRLARVLYLGAQFQGSFFGGDGANATGGTSFLLAALFGVMSNPEGAGIFFEVGAGYRTFNITTFSGNNIGSTGGEFILGLGAQIKAGSFRVIPKIDIYLGGGDPEASNFLGMFTVGLAFMWEYPFDKPVVQANVQTY